MKVVITQENLNRALSIVSRVVGSSATLPVLANVLIFTDGKRLKLSATNLEIGINYWLGAKVVKPGKITVPARLLNDFISNLPKSTVNLEVSKNSLFISTDHFQTTLNGIDAEEFPTIPVVAKGTKLNVNAEDFKAAAAKVVLVSSRDDTRPVLNGVYLYIKDQKLIMVATDSYRLAETKIKLAAPVAKTDFGVIVPARTITELLKMIDEGVDKLEFLIEDNQILIRFGEAELVSRMIDGEFPDYHQLIPKNSSTKVIIDTAEFAALAKVANLFTQSTAGSVTFEVDSASGTLHLKSVASQVGENTSSAKVEVEGEDATLALNPRYISEALSVINSPKVSFGITGKVNPCLLKPEGESDYLHIIMPLRS